MQITDILFLNHLHLHYSYYTYILFRNFASINSIKFQIERGVILDSKFIGERLTELRLKKNVSEYQMSLDLGRNKTYIQSITSGRNLPKMNHFLEICEYLDVSPKEFFDDELHHIPLQQKANELLKQLEEEDLLAIISILSRLTSKNK